MDYESIMKARLLRNYERICTDFKIKERTTIDVVQNELLRKYGIPKKRLRVVYNIVLRADIVDNILIFSDPKFCPIIDDDLEFEDEPTKTDVRYNEINVTYITSTCIVGLLPIMAVEIAPKSNGQLTMARRQISRLP